MPRSCTPRKWTRCCASPASSRHSRPGRVKEPSVASQGGALAMHDLLPAWPLLSAFLVASLILAVTPGPGVFYIVTRSVAQGRRCGLASVAGVALGNLGNAIGASLGLAVLFAVSSIAFTVVKYAGALYLVYLGVQAIRTRRSNGHIPLSGSGPLWQVFRDGFVVALLDPKNALFFTAFLLQIKPSDAEHIIHTILPRSICLATAP